MTVHYFNEVPAGFLDLDPRDLHTILPGPSIIELEGDQKQPLFISTLLHGNETSGIYALQMLLREYFTSNKTLPRSLMIFIGNIDAAKMEQRKLDHQQDFNRVWNAAGEGEEYKMAAEVLAYAKAKQVFASIDIHNNTGWNPYYGCLNSLDNRFLNLVKLFSRRVVYFIQPTEVQSIAFKDFTTSVTLECGQAGDLTGIQRVKDFIEAVMNLDELSEAPISNDEISIYHSVARILIPKQSSVGFEVNANTDFRFVPNFECLNFMELPEHSLLGWRGHEQHQLQILDEQNHDVSHEYIAYQNNEIRTHRPVVPCMFCCNERIIRQDCLGYFMQRYQL